MIILKIGGSILTKKDSAEPEVDYENLNRIASEIEESLNSDSINRDLSDGLIIVHGAGSFGHPPASKYKIGEPFNDEEYPFKRLGFAEIQNQVKKLNSIICDSLIEHNIPVVSIPPSSFVTTVDKRIYEFRLGIIKKYIKEGYVPVLYGDIVLDEDLKMAIISGDQVLQYIAKILKSDNIILGTDVDGVYTKSPKTHNDAKLIPILTNLNQIEELESTNNIDVTGGMVGKVKELLELAHLGIDSEIVNANNPRIIANALQSKEIKSTKITERIEQYNY
ncbi:MAG: isopentenyl phosphate kinase family protein [Methanobacteriaceae archaeon]|nr:isopentenyl phosphate kinase family protein [Methanobacteriaceae archaeon]